MTSDLVADDVDAVLDLRHPLAQHGEELRDGGPGVLQDLLAGGVAGVKEGEG